MADQGTNTNSAQHELKFEDEIHIRDLLVQALIGEDTAREHRQAVTCHVTLWVHGAAAAISDALNYSWVAQLVAQCSAARVRSLAQLADEIARSLLSKTGNVPRVAVTVTQPTAVNLAKTAELHVTRSKVIVPPYAHQGAPHVLAENSPINGNASTNTEPRPGTHRAILGMGSNLDDRLGTINRALTSVARLGTINRLSFLYESPAKYVEDQPDFLNLCLIIDTEHSAMDLLRNIKSIEEELGRQPVPLTARNGPRLIDIDILYYDRDVISRSVLVVPHPSIYERDFVLRPLCDIVPDYRDPVRNVTVRELWAKYSNTEAVKLRQVTPVTWKTKLGNIRRVMWTVRDWSTVPEPCATHLIGVLNVTTDSFSGDGLARDSSAATAVTAVSQARRHVTGGATLLEVGAESSRPGATPVPVDLEVARVTSTITALRQDDSFDSVPVVVDTVKCAVARAALECGASVLNDVSGAPDGQLLALARDWDCPIVLQHSRGTPGNMSQLTEYGVPSEHVIEVVAKELQHVIDQALQIGIKPWNIITDPGLGFAKTPEQSLAILSHLSRWHVLTGGYPLYIGPSRKGFIGHVTGRQEPSQRVWGTAGAVSASIAGGAHFVRVHDLPEMWDVARVCDAIFKSK